jgi:hypothetical protein
MKMTVYWDVVGCAVWQKFIDVLQAIATTIIRAKSRPSMEVESTS